MKRTSGFGNVAIAMTALISIAIPHPTTPFPNPLAFVGFSQDVMQRNEHHIEFPSVSKFVSTEKAEHVHQRYKNDWHLDYQIQRDREYIKD